MNRRRLRHWALLAVFSSLALPVAWCAAAAPAPLAEQDRQFLYWATESGKAAAAMDELALEKSRNPAITGFARHALDEERRRDADLAALGQAHGASPPQAPDKESRDLHDNLAATDGDFDRLFIRNEVDEARKTINLYEDEALAGESPEIRGLVARELPTLQRIYEAAREAALQLPGMAPLMSSSGTVETHKPSPPPMSR